MSKIQQNKSTGMLFVNIPSHVAKVMGLQKGEQVAFIADSDELARMKVIR